VFSVWGFSWGKAKKADGKWVASAAAKFGDRLRHFVDAAGKLTVRRCSVLVTWGFGFGAATSCYWHASDSETHFLVRTIRLFSA
jgi:hypothetical protein